MPQSDYYRIAAPYFDGIYRSKGYTEDIGYYVELAKSAGGSVLEMGCGTGRILIPIAQAGINIHGIDASKEMLATCRTSAMRNAVEIQNRISLTLGDIESAHVGRHFELIILPFRVFQELTTVQAQRAVLRNVRRHLDANGIACLDVFQPNYRYVAEASDERLDSQYSDRFYKYEVKRFARTVPRPTEQIIEIHHRWEIRAESGEMLQQFAAELDLRWFTRDEIEQLLELEGFEPVAYLGGFRGEEYSTASKEQIVQFRSKPRQ